MKNGAANMSPKPKAPWPVPLIAHKGASAYCIQNTLPAFRKAIEMGALAIELDVHMVAATAVVFHNYKDIAKRCKPTKTEEEVRQLSSAELRALTLHEGCMPTGKVPTLEEALNEIDRRAVVNIHLKEQSAGVGVEKVIKEFISEKGWQASASPRKPCAKTAR